MAIDPIQFIYRGDLSAIGDFHSECFVDSLVTGNITEIHFRAESVDNFTDSWFFGLKVNGVAVLSGTDRPQITSGDLAPSKTGLSIPVTFLDRLTPTVDARGGGTVRGPIVITLKIEDSTGAEVAEAIHAAGAATPADADEFGFWQAVSGLLKKATWSGIKSALTTLFDARYATPADVSAAVSGLSWKQGVRVATTTAGTLASSFENGDTVDGIVLSTGDRILIKDQADPTENGIYVVAVSGAPARASDADAGTELVNASVFVSAGTDNAHTQWVQITAGPITLGTDDVVFTQFNSSTGISFDDLSDVDAAAPDDGEVPVFDSISGNWINSNSMGPLAGQEGLSWDPVAHTTSIGDYNNNGNGSTLIVDDVAETITANKPVVGPINGYDAATWNGSAKFATEDAIRDKIEAMLLSLPISDDAYDALAWDGVSDLAPSQNAMRDVIESLIATIASSVLPDGDYGDIVVSGSGSVITIDNKAVTLAKMADVATASILGRNTAGTGVPEVLSVSTVKSMLGIGDAMLFKGIIDCSANPNYPAADAGDVYKVSVAGKIGGVSGPNVEVGDTLYCIADSTASGNQATVGANWDIIQVNVDGAVTGPASAVSANVATFNGTTGKIIQDGGKALPSGSIVGTSDTQTLTNKRVTARVGSTTSSATPTPDADANDVYEVTALGAGATFAAPSGTPTDGQPLMLRIKDDGTARTLAFNAIYRAIGVTLPTTTVISKTLYIGCIYNSADSKWDVLGVNQQA